MKKTMIAIAAVIMFSACNNSNEGTATTVDSTKVDASTPAVEAK